MKKSLLSLAGAALLLTGCAGIAPDTYKAEQPKFDIRDYFNGDIEAHGILIGRSGKVEKRFTVTMTGKWQGNSGTLAEHFVYSDGKQEDRVWHFNVLNDNEFTGSAHDVVGQSRGYQYGNAVNMKYVLRVPVGKTTYDIVIDDWLYRMDDKTVLNRSELSKFGMKVGELVITFRKK